MNRNLYWVLTLSSLLMVLLSACIPAIGTSPLRPVVASASGEVKVKAGTTTYIASLSEFGRNKGCVVHVSVDEHGRSNGQPLAFNTQDLTSSFEFSNISAPSNWKIELASVVARCKDKTKVVFAITIPAGETQDTVNTNITLQTIKTKEPQEFKFKILVEK